jgi:hypothetical protein
MDAITKNVSDIREKDRQQDDKIYNLEARTKGVGGYLNSYNFESATPSQDDLTNYALQQIGITEKTEIFDGTKIINEYNKHLWILTNTLDSEPAVFEWADLGEVQNISVATNKLLGLVKGSTEDLKGSIDLNGEISINNLSTLQGQVVNHSTQISSIGDQARKVTSRVESLEGELPNKQDKLTAGSGISIENNIISTSEEHPIPLIIGEKDNPINLATDILDGYSLIQGYIFVTSTLSNQFNTKSLIYKITNSDDSCYVYSYNDSNLVVSNSLLKVASNGTIDLTQTKIISAIGKINGIDQVLPTPTDIYVPTESGTEGQVLKSQGEGKEPVWVTVAEEQSYAPYIEITPATATNGTFEDSDFTNLTEHNEVYIILNNEIYRKADLENTPGIISYTHNGWNGSQTLDKSINITVSTKAWTLKIGSPDEKPIQNSANTVSSGGVYSALQDLGSYEDVIDLSSDNVTKTASIIRIGHIVKQMTTFTVTGNSEKT